MNILLIGPQGSGKGTQARILTEKYGFYYFESGEFLRKVAKKNEDLKKSLAKGEIVPDKEMTSYLTAFLDEKNLYDDIIFDGFPRTVDQYNFLKNWLSDKKVSLDLIIVLTISEEETLRRLTARRMDPATELIYNLVTQPPPASVDINSLVQRDDDKPEAIKRRLALYRERTKPLITELKKYTNLIEVNGERSVRIIAQESDAIVAKNHDQNQN